MGTRCLIHLCADSSTVDRALGRVVDVEIGFCVYFFVQAEDGIRDLVRSRGLGDVYKRQVMTSR